MKPLKKGPLLGLQVKQVADHVTYRVGQHDITSEVTGARTLAPVVEIAMGGNATLWWCAWPDFLPRPQFPADAKYHPVRSPYTVGGMIDQPRKSVCYGHAYRYSGRLHPVEPETPQEILQLYRLVEDLFGVQVNMCLANGYYHGNHSISKHSDDEKEMGDLHDVFCFVTGATRPAVFRTKEQQMVVLKVDLPEGLYVMRGSDFQKNLTHEFPKVYETAFKNAFVKCVPTAVSTMDMTTMEKADWLWMHQDEVKEKLRGTKYFDDFIQWSQSRFSFTLRHFTEVKEVVKDEENHRSPPTKKRK
jgi:alkylated DNA repair dioxygenase AlkB